MDPLGDGSCAFTNRSFACRRRRGFAAVRLFDLREGGGEEPGRIQPLNFTHRRIGVYKKIGLTRPIGPPAPGGCQHGAPTPRPIKSSVLGRSGRRGLRFASCKPPQLRATIDGTVRTPHVWIHFRLSTTSRYEHPIASHPRLCPTPTLAPTPTRFFEPGGHCPRAFSFPADCPLRKGPFLGLDRPPRRIFWPRSRRFNG